MSKSKGPDLPPVPTFQSDPNVGWSQDNLKQQYDYLIKGLTTNGGNLSGLLGDAVNLNPETSRLATEQYVSAQEPAYRRGLQDITNTLEANNQLTGSTTGNVMQNYQNDYLAGLTSANAGMALQDINRALSNRVSLYSTGLSTAQGVGQAGLQNQSQQNQFALQNYENQVATALSQYQTDQQNKAFWGNMAGNLLGPLGGATIGGMTGGQTGASSGAASGWATSAAIAGMMMGSPQGLNNKAQQSSPGYISGGGESIYSPSSSYSAGMFQQPRLNYANSGLGGF
jgi:hypothetical protein